MSRRLHFTRKIPSSRALQEISPFVNVRVQMVLRRTGDVHHHPSMQRYSICSCFFFFCAKVCICLVAHVGVCVPDEPAHVEAEGQEAGPQQVTQGRQVRDGEVVGVHAPAPHPVDQPVCQVEEDHDLQQDEEKQ